MIKSIAVGVFALLMAFNITMTIQDHDAVGVDLSLTGLKTMAFGGGEGGDSGCDGRVCSNYEICTGPWYWRTCYTPCGDTSSNNVNCTASEDSGCVTETCGIFD